VSQSPFSGADNAPKFGDFECHRHWVESTHHLDYGLWYLDNSALNYTYWPLDYPPLCAYAHMGLYHVVTRVDPQAVQFQQSYGHMAPKYVSLMRLVVILGEFLVFLPALKNIVDRLFQRGLYSDV
jgi:alpha-1,3-glucosyltransferase